MVAWEDWLALVVAARQMAADFSGDVVRRVFLVERGIKWRVDALEAPRVVHFDSASFLQTNSHTLDVCCYTHEAHTPVGNPVCCLSSGHAFGTVALALQLQAQQLPLLQPLPPPPRESPAPLLRCSYHRLPRAIKGSPPESLLSDWRRSCTRTISRTSMGSFLGLALSLPARRRHYECMS